MLPLPYLGGGGSWWLTLWDQTSGPSENVLFPVNREFWDMWYNLNWFLVLLPPRLETVLLLGMILHDSRPRVSPKQSCTLRNPLTLIWVALLIALIGVFPIGLNLNWPAIFFNILFVPFKIASPSFLAFSYHCLLLYHAFSQAIGYRYTLTSYRICKWTAVCSTAVSFL